MPKILDLDGKELLDTRTSTLKDFDMSGKDLSQADISGLIFAGTNLKHTVLRHANLTDADLSGAKNLLPEQLAGTNLTRAKLPDSIKNFDGIKQVDDRIKDTGKFFLAMLAADAYSLLTLWSTKNLDFKLITDSSDATLPIFNTPLSIVKFCLVAPLVLLGAYVYFQLEMQRLWEELVGLPTIFPDGKRLDQRVYPWFVTSFVQRYSPRSKDKQEAQPNAVLIWVLQVLIGFFVWLATPLVIIGFWLAYIKKREFTGTAWLEVLMAMCFVWGWVTLRRTRRLIGTNRVVYPNKAPRIGFKKLRDWGKVLAQTVAVGVLFHILSFGLIYSVPNEKDSRMSEHRNLGWWDARVWASKLTEPLIGYRPVPVMNDVEVSTKPADWSVSEIDFQQKSQKRLAEIGVLREKLAVIGENTKQNGYEQTQSDLKNKLKEGQQAFEAHTANVKGAKLSKFRFRYMEAKRAFFVKADFRGADISKAQLSEADLRGTNFELSENFELQKSLKPTNLSGADLSLAHLEYADLTGVDLIGANLTKSHLALANLTRADLSGADLSGADLIGAYLTNAILTRANLNTAYLIAAHLTDADLTDTDMYGAYLTYADLTRANLTHSRLKGAILYNAHMASSTLSGANFTRAILAKADLENAVLTNANLTQVDLSSAILSGADLTGANLTDAVLNGAKFDKAKITKEQILKAKWGQQTPIEIPTIWKLTPYHNWKPADEKQWKYRHVLTK